MQTDTYGTGVEGKRLCKTMTPRIFSWWERIQPNSTVLDLGEIHKKIRVKNT